LSDLLNFAFWSFFEIEGRTSIGPAAAACVLSSTIFALTIAVHGVSDATL
jgi:hypothetical protein